MRRHVIVALVITAFVAAPIAVPARSRLSNDLGYQFYKYETSGTVTITTDVTYEVQDQYDGINWDWSDPSQTWSQTLDGSSADSFGAFAATTAGQAAGTSIAQAVGAYGSSFVGSGSLAAGSAGELFGIASGLVASPVGLLVAGAVVGY